MLALGARCPLLLVSQREVLRELIQRELLTKLAGAVLVGEHAFFPERLFARAAGDPFDRDRVFGVLVAVGLRRRAMTVAARER